MNTFNMILSLGLMAVLLGLYARAAWRLGLRFWLLLLQLVGLTALWIVGAVVGFVILIAVGHWLASLPLIVIVGAFIVYAIYDTAPRRR
jgi:hypothetical protein